MTRRMICSLIAFAAMQAVSAVSDSALAANESASTKRIGACHIEQAGAYHALAEISEKANIVIGVEAVQPEKEPTVVLDFPGGTVADLLNMFTARVPDYSWQEASNGVVHVTRTSAHVSLLDVGIAYPGADNKTRQQIWEDIAVRPEVSAWMNSVHCSREELFHGGEFRTHNGPISIAPGSFTVEQLLDDVAVKSGDNYWAVLQSPRSSSSCRVSIILW
jgi:hypothetical protein